MRVEHTLQAMTDRLGHFPCVAELAQFMNLEIDDVLDALQTSQARYGLSLDGPTNHAESGTETLGEVLGAEDEHYSRADIRIDLAARMRRLPYPQRAALALRLGRDLNQREIAERLGCSQMQVSRLIVRAIKQLQIAATV